MSRDNLTAGGFAQCQGTSVAVLIDIGAAGPLIDFPGNREAGPVLARSTVAFEAGDEGREVAVMFEFGDPLRPLIIGVIQDGQNAARRAPATTATLWTGTVRSLRSDDRVDVETEGRVITCLLLDTGVGTLSLSEGESVLLAGMPGRPPCILGAIRNSVANKRLELKADQISLNAGEELVLKTKQAQLILRSNGDIETRGVRITSRARNLQKLMAPTIRLN